jgi:hypothetical protein
MLRGNTGSPCATNHPSWCKLESFSALRPDFLSRLLALAKFVRSRLPRQAVGRAVGLVLDKKIERLLRNISTAPSGPALGLTHLSFWRAGFIRNRFWLRKTASSDFVCAALDTTACVLPASPPARPTACSTASRDRRGRRDRMKCVEATSCTGNPGSLLCPGKCENALTWQGRKSS